ncbi:MAG: adenylate cyclase [Gaiellaceae bacterium]
MRALLTAAVTVIVLCIFAVAGAPAANPPGTGQPSQSCLSSTAPNEPGQAANAPGSAFNETGPGTAGTVYAGNGQTTLTPANSAAVSQYDVACFQVSQH